MIEKIISGAQSGADIAGLNVARDLGISTGGTMPLGYRTEYGDRPEYKDMYNVTENEHRNYLYRTEENVMNSDGTLVFGNATEGGSLKTIKFCRTHKKPWYVITFPEENLCKLSVKDWIEVNNIKILNIAGNRESTNPGISLFTYSFLKNELTRTF